MVAIINLGSAIRRAYLYNDNKRKEGIAECISVRNFFGPTEQLNHETALKTLLRLAETRPDVKVNSVHISLNFSPDERIDDGKMNQIAVEYMEQIGFGDQPYLVYRHHDSGHPHCHIVTTNITISCERIPLHKIGKLRSEPARKALELKYGLVKAEDQRKQIFALSPVDAQKVQYGKLQTKRAIGNVLVNVLKRYRYTSLPELNAVLNLYNVHAERGETDSKTYKNGGLIYRVLDANGEPVGVPIKASLFHDRPTLAFLEQQFLKNDVARQEHKSGIMGLIDFTLKSKQPKTIEAFSEALKRSGIRMISRVNKDGFIYGITYVDFRSKSVFNGSALDKNYSAKAIQERIGLHQRVGIQRTKPEIVSPHPTAQAADPNQGAEYRFQSPEPSGNSLLEQLMQHEYASQQVPYQWRKMRKKKKKR